MRKIESCSGELKNKKVLGDIEWNVHILSNLIYNLISGHIIDIEDEQQLFQINIKAMVKWMWAQTIEVIEKSS